ncbi:MAG: glycosyltransferase [Proteobacteria bacterium]|nr:glycosyltransferase [Pseudomonadota bacterium]
MIAQPEVLGRFESNHPTLQVLRNERNSGVAHSANVGLAKATGSLIVMSAADDRLAPTFVEKLAGVMEQHPHAGLATSYFTTFVSSTDEVHEGRMDWSTQPAYLSPAYLIAKQVGGHIPGHASIYRREMIETAGGVLSELKWHCDWFLNHVIAARTGICFIPEKLAYLRINDTPSYSAGQHNWELQRPVIRSLLTLVLEGDYRDVKDFFQGAKIFSPLNMDVRRLILEFPAWMTPEFLAEAVQMLRKEEITALLASINGRAKQLEELFHLCRAKLFVP